MFHLSKLLFILQTILIKDVIVSSYCAFYDK